MFVRRHYYDLSTGETVFSYMRQGAVLQGSIENDFNTYEQLAERSLADTGVFEWLEPNEAIEKQFTEHDGVKVENGELVFFDLPESEDPTYDELMEAYTILTGGEVNE